MFLQTRLTDNISTQIYEGDVLQEPEDATESGFNIILVNLNGRQYKTLQKKWQGDHYHSQESDDDWTSLITSINDSDDAIGGNRLHYVGYTNNYKEPITGKVSKNMTVDESTIGDKEPVLKFDFTIYDPYLKRNVSVYYSPNKDLMVYDGKKLRRGIMLFMAMA